VSKMEGKTNFSRCLKQFDGLTWLTPTPLFYDRSSAVVAKHAKCMSLWQERDAEGVRVKRQTARFCRWMGDRIGYRCDGPVERWAWRQYNRFRHGATDCNSFCTSRGNSGGRCVSGNADRSTWCPRGQRCSCY